MKPQWIAALALLSLSFTSSIHAADARFCDHYAKTAIKQQINNVKAGCGHSGLRWSPLYVEQNTWCMTVRKSIAANETKERNKALEKCGTGPSKDDFSKIPFRYSALDSMFAQMKAATIKDDVIAVKVMHAHGVSIHHQDGGNYAAMLYQAVDNQAEKTASYLLSQGADPRIIKNGGGSPLSSMLEDDKINYRMLAMLLANGFDPNYGGEGYTDESYPLILSAKQNDYRSVQMLLKAGAEANFTRDSNALLYAINNRNMSMVRMLVDAGADVNKPASIAPCLPLDMANKSGSYGLIKYLTGKGAKASKNCG